MDLKGTDTPSLLKNNALVRKKIAKVIHLEHEKVQEPPIDTASQSLHSHEIKPDFTASKVDLELAAIREQGLQTQINELSSNLANVTGTLMIKSQQLSKLLKDKASLEDSHRVSLRTRDSVIDEKSKIIEELNSRLEYIDSSYSDHLWNEVNDVNEQLRSDLARLSGDNQALQAKVDALTRNATVQLQTMGEYIDYAAQCKEQLNQIRLGPESAGVARSARLWVKELEQRNQGLNKSLKDAVLVHDQLGRLKASTDTATTLWASIARELDSLKALVGESQGQTEAVEKSMSTPVSEMVAAKAVSEPMASPETPELAAGEKRKRPYSATATERGTDQQAPSLGCAHCQQPAHGMMHKCSSCERVFHSACAREPDRKLCGVCSVGAREASPRKARRGGGEAAP
jgi:hypothetical protein